MRPLGVYLIGISIYILDVIQFLMIVGNFGGFAKMLTDTRTHGRMDGRTDDRTRPLIEMRSRI